MKTSAIATVLLCLSGFSSEAAETYYDLDWKGVPIGEVKFLLEREESRYKVSYEVRSTGILNMLFSFESRGYSSGLVMDDEIVATTHSAISNVRGEPRSWTVGFGLDGLVSNLQVQEDDEREPVPESLRKAPDPLALALSALGDAEPGIKLEGQSFDGRRAVRLGMVCDETRTAADELVCTVEGELLAGASRRWQDDDDDDDEQRRPVQVTLARNIVGDGWWPVRLEVESRWGAVSANLVRPRADLAR